MKDLKTRLSMLTKKIWWFGPLSAGVVGIGLTYCVGISLGFLLYLGSLSQFSLTPLIVFFCSALALLVNLLLLYGASASKAHLLLPWLLFTMGATLALLVYTAVQWSSLGMYKGGAIGVIMFSSYFFSVVSTLYHQLRKRDLAAVAATKAVEEEGVGTPRAGGQVADKEETVLVLLDQETPSPTSIKLPRPDEVISVPLSSNNPFLSDVFKVKKLKKSESDTVTNINADFTPFKGNDDNEGNIPSKLNVFLPHTEEDESDFDFSFNDPAFDSSLCAKSNNENGFS